MLSDHTSNRFGVVKKKIVTRNNIVGRFKTMITIFGRLANTAVTIRRMTMAKIMPPQKTNPLFTGIQQLWKRRRFVAAREDLSREELFLLMSDFFQNLSI